LLFRRIKAYYPDFIVPKVYFSISGIGSFPLNRTTDIFLSQNNEILVIGLDWFLGPAYKYPLPETIPQYIARRYIWQNIPSFVAQLIGNRYNDYNTQDQTVLNEMLGYAKTYYFAQSVIPCLPDSTVLGYTSKQMEYVLTNKDAIWKHYLDNQVFFATAGRIKKITLMKVLLLYLSAKNVLEVLLVGADCKCSKNMFKRKIYLLPK
jgi:hypothetical protein